MNPVLTALRAIEARAEHAIDQELQTMMQEILALRTTLALRERSEADSLLMKLDRLIGGPTLAPAASIAPSHAMEPVQSPAMVYQARFFDPKYGSLEDVVTTDSFPGAVQTAFSRLDKEIDCTVDASWSHGRGHLEVQTLDGIVIACVQAMPAPVVQVHPAIVRACQALRSGETVVSRAQFVHALMERAEH